MGITQDIAEVEQERAEIMEQLVSLRARLVGVESRLAALKSGASDDTPLASIDRTEAIVRVLGDAGSVLSTAQVTELLQVGGRSDKQKDVTATLSYLLKIDRVVRVGRGQYSAA